MLLTLGGIFGVIVGGKEENATEEATLEGEEQKESSMQLFEMYILLISTPFLSAGGQVAMRKMTKFNDSVVSWYLQWTTLFTSAVIMWIAD